jgi:hypothetical protein
MMQKIARPFCIGETCRPKRFVGIFGDRRTKKILRRALRWKVFSFPRRAPSPEDQIQDLNQVKKAFAATVS